MWQASTHIVQLVTSSICTYVRRPGRNGMTRCWNCSRREAMKISRNSVKHSKLHAKLLLYRLICRSFAYDGVVDLRWYKIAPDGQIWWCSNKKCTFKFIICKHSFFSTSRCSTELIVKIIYFWTHKYPTTLLCTMHGCFKPYVLREDQIYKRRLYPVVLPVVMLTGCHFCCLVHFRRSVTIHGPGI